MSHNADQRFMARALVLANRGAGRTSPNPMVGAVIVRAGRILGEGYHSRAGEPHAEIEALKSAQSRGSSIAGATLYVTLEPCSTFGRTPPCTGAIIGSGLKRVVIGAIDPNPWHAGRGLELLRDAGMKVEHGILEAQCNALNAAFNHWIVHRRPYVTVKAAMTLDGKIATPSRESKWITGPQARAAGMALRFKNDAVLVGVNTILSDDPGLTVRSRSGQIRKPIKRFVLDSLARTPLSAKVLTDDQVSQTTVFVTGKAPTDRIRKLNRYVNVEVTQHNSSGLNLKSVLDFATSMNVTSLLVEGGGEVNASFLSEGLAQRVVFFYAPKILGGARACKGVAGPGLPYDKILSLEDLSWTRIGPDLLLTASVRLRQKIQKRVGKRASEC